VSMIKKIWLDK